MHVDRRDERVADDAPRPRDARLGRRAARALRRRRGAAAASRAPRASVVGEASCSARRVPVAGIAGDQQAALFGQGCFAPGRRRPRTARALRARQHRRERRAARRTGCSRRPPRAPATAPRTRSRARCFVAGAALQWLRDGLGLIDERGRDARRSRGRSSRPTASYFVPALTGLGSPYWDPDARGLDHRADARARRGRTSCAPRSRRSRSRSRDVLDAMPGAVELLRADGGVDANALPDAAPGRPARRRPSRSRRNGGDGTRRGRARPDRQRRLAGAGGMKARWRRAARFEPGGDRARADDLYAGWNAALERAR